jgi:hypothetical protein
MTDAYLNSVRARMSRRHRINEAIEAWRMLRAWVAVGRFDMATRMLNTIADLSGPPKPLTLGEMLAISGAVQ